MQPSPAMQALIEQIYHIFSSLSGAAEICGLL